MTAAQRLNCVGPVSMCLEGPGPGVNVVKIYDAAGRFLVEARVSPRLVRPDLLLVSLQSPPIGFN
jgi:hypothetical protein